MRKAKLKLFWRKFLNITKIMRLQLICFKKISLTDNLVHIYIYNESKGRKKERVKEIL